MSTKIIRVIIAFGLGGVLLSTGITVYIEGCLAPLGIIGAIVFAASVLCAWGMWRMRRWALKLSWFIALAVFVCGCYGVYFMWTFWMSGEPTLWDRIKSVLHPLVVMHFVLPVFWLIYFTRPNVKGQFK